MQGEREAKADCYSEQERAGMSRYQQWKDRRLLPLLTALTRVGVTPSHVTLLSTLAGLAFCPLYFRMPAVAYGMLLAHLLLDGMDGPLARHRQSASRRGSFTDTVGDQLVVAATTVTWMYARTQGLPGPAGIDVLAGGIYLFLYTIVVVFAMVRNALGIPYVWLVRPRNLVYAWLFLESFFFRNTAWAGSIDYVVWGCNAVLAVKSVTGYFHIRAKL